MSYSSSKSTGTDFARGAIDLTVRLVVNKLFKDLETVVAKPHPEQSVLAMLVCLRKISEEFPVSLELSFSRSQFEEIKAGFYEWYEKVEGKIPAKYRKGLLEEAAAEFARWENDMLAPKKAP